MAQEVSSLNMYDSIIKDRRIKVFLSSTFKDMSEERDYLAKNVFMELEAEALKRNVALNLLDLRWGITAEESKQGLVTEICLKEIEASRPFFIGIVGDRYGWIPSEEDFSENSSLFESFPWVKEDIKNGLSITEIEIQYGVLRNKLPLKAFFYIKETSKDDTLDDSKEAKKLRHLKEQILTQKEHPVKYYKTVKELGEQIKLDIQQQMNLVFPKQEEMNAIEESTYIQECILRAKTDFYVSLDGAYEYIDNFVNSPQRLLVIRGESGSGKSSLLANWVSHYKNKNYNVLYHFVDSSGHCNSYPMIIIRFYNHICSKIGRIPTIDWTSMFFEQYVDCLNELLLSTNERFVFVIDALNQLDRSEDSFSLQWFPNLNEKVKIVCSTNDEIPEILQALTNKSAINYSISLFKGKDIQLEAANGYLKRFGKKLEYNQIDKINQNKLFENPLLFFSLIEELRLWGSYEELNNIIADYVNVSSTDELLNKIFHRIESDFSTTSDEIVGEVFSILFLCRNGVLDTDIANILEVPQIYVSLVMSKCHRFISILGGKSIIAHQVISSYVERRYVNTIAVVKDKYKRYLQERLKFAEKRAYTDTVLALGYLYYQTQLDDDLFELCTNPNSFISLSFFGGSDEDVYFKYLYAKGFALHRIVERLDEIKSEIKEIAIPQILIRARAICANIHANESLRIILEFGESFYSSKRNDEVDKTERLRFLVDCLTYHARKEHIEKAIELSDEILSIAGNDNSDMYFKAKAYNYKAEMLRDSDFEQCVVCLEQSINLSLELGGNDAAIVSLINLGLFQSQKGVYDRALRNYERALQLIDREIQNDASLIIQRETCYGNMAALYDRLSNYEQKIKYEYLANKCFDIIQDSVFINRLQPIQVVSRSRGLGFDLMKEGKIKEGIDQLNKALETLECYQKEMSFEAYQKEKFFILHDISKGYAFNREFVSAAKQLISYNKEITNAFHGSPQLYHELFFDYSITLANVLSDLGYNQASIVCLNSVIKDVEFIRKNYSLGKKSYLAEIWRKIAIIRIDEKESKAAINAFENAINEYVILIEEDTSFLKAMAKVEIEKEYYSVNGVLLKDFDEIHLKQVFKDKKYSGSILNTYIAIYLLVIFMDDNEDDCRQAAEYVELILDSEFFKYERRNSPQLVALLPVLAESCDKISISYFDIRNMDKSVYYSKLSISLYDRIPADKYILQKLLSIQHIANILDTAGEKEEAVGYYKKALGELTVINNLDENLIYQKASLLYDYGIALYGTDIVESEKILKDAYKTASTIYNEHSYVAILIAEIQDSLGSIYDDLNRFEEAESMFKSAIHVLCNEDKDDPSIARRIGKSYNNYGIMLLKQNSTNEAIRMLQQSREVRLNKDFLGLIRTNDLLYKLAVEEGKLNDAYTYLVEIIDAEEKFDIYGGGMLNDYVNHIDAFSNICIQLKKTNEGKNAYKKVFELALRIVKEYGSSNEGMRNVSIIYQRINKLFGTTDFLKQ